MLSDPDVTTVLYHRVRHYHCPHFTDGINQGRAKSGNGSYWNAELVEVDSLSMTLLFGERRVGEETGGPLYTLLPTIAPVR